MHYLITLAHSAAVLCMYACSPAAAVHWAVELVDGDGICTVCMVIPFNSSIPGACIDPEPQ